MEKRNRGQAEEIGETKREETKRKTEREQASVSGVSNAGSEVLMMGREGANVGKYVSRWMSLPDSLLHISAFCYY